MLLSVHLIQLSHDTHMTAMCSYSVWVQFYFYSEIFFPVITLFSLITKAVSTHYGV